MRLVLIESPYAGAVAANLAYARKAMLDSISRGEAPMASHLLYPQVLDDTIPLQRNLGIACGLRWGMWASISAFYMDRGFSDGMAKGLDAAASNRFVAFRFIERPPTPDDDEFISGLVTRYRLTHRCP